ncbi:MAG: CHASE3 domain-containing protein, partial [Candidatus Wallbacteria bacterium]|nr:CHASE3 domain-containing protein [Candidatus Wallbacteria bacterium]
MRYTVGAKLGGAFGLSLLFLGTIGAASYHSTTQLIEATDQATHSQQSAAKMDALLQALMQAESNSRAFIVGGDRTYQDAFEAAAKRVSTTQDDLFGYLRSHDPERLRQLEPLPALIAQKVAIDREEVALRESRGPDAAIQAFKTGRGREVAAQIRHRIQAGEKEEVEGMFREAADGQIAGRAAHMVIGLGTFLAIFFVSVLSFQLTRHFTDTLAALQHATLEIERGNLQVAIPISTDDEFADLSRSFRSMVSDLKERAQAARQISRGELDVRVGARGPDDEFGAAFES